MLYYTRYYIFQDLSGYFGVLTAIGCHTDLKMNSTNSYRQLQMLSFINKMFLTELTNNLQKCVKICKTESV